MSIFFWFGGKYRLQSHGSLRGFGQVAYFRASGRNFNDIYSYVIAMVVQWPRGCAAKSKDIAGLILTAVTAFQKEVKSENTCIPRFPHILNILCKRSKITLEEPSTTMRTIKCSFVKPQNLSVIVISG